MSNVYFYQSTYAINTQYDSSNPLHTALYRELTQSSINYRKATALMKKAGFKPGYARDFFPNTRWSSDIFIVERDSSGRIVKWITL